MQIPTLIESKRGCGYRKRGGLYLMGPPLSRPCCKLPKELTICPTCGHGIKFSRGWTWIDPVAIFDGECNDFMVVVSHNTHCVLRFPEAITKLGLLWIGEKFYHTTVDFLLEANQQGISRRIAHVPRDFVLGETWVALAHIKAINNQTPGIFSLFLPSAIEYIVKGDETEEQLANLVDRGIQPISVKPLRRAS